MKIQVLDGLRGYAALMIVVAHIPVVTGTHLGSSIHTFIDASRMAYLGVDIFFVLSGFLITRILLKEKRENKLSFKKFYIKRSLRIFPTYFLTVVVVGFLINWDRMGYVAAYLSNYFFAINFDPHPMRHTWSLAVEEHFYLVWPFLIYTLSIQWSKRVILWLTPAFVLANIVLIALMFSESEAFAMMYRASQIRILSLAAGSAIAYYETPLRNLSKRAIYSTFAIFLFATIVGLSYDRFFETGTMLRSTLNLLFFGTMSVTAFLLVLQLEQRRGVLRWVFTNWLAVNMGLISYGIYLYHYPIMYAFGYTGPQIGTGHISIIELMALVAAVFIVPIASYFLIEKRALKLKDSITKKM